MARTLWFAALVAGAKLTLSCAETLQKRWARSPTSAKERDEWQQDVDARKKRVEEKKRVGEKTGSVPTAAS